MGHHARLTDPHFAYVYALGVDKGLKSMIQQQHQPLLSNDAMELLTCMLQPNPSQRPSVIDCLASPWFKMMNGVTHLANLLLVLQRCLFLVAGCPMHKSGLFAF